MNSVEARGLIAGGISGATAAGVVELLEQAGVPIPHGTEPLFQYILAPLAALGGYVLGHAAGRSKRFSGGIGLGLLVFGVLALGVITSNLYFYLVLQPISPGPIYVFIEAVAFSSFIFAIYMLVGQIGGRSSTPSE